MATRWIRWDRVLLLAVSWLMLLSAERVVDTDIGCRSVLTVEAACETKGCAPIECSKLETVVDSSLRHQQADTTPQKGQSRRVLLQDAGEDAEEDTRADFPCALSRRQRRDLLNRSRREWTVGEAAWRDLDSDLQSVVNCTREGDVILLELTTTVTPPRAIVIPWNLTITAAVDMADVTRGTIPEASSPVNFTCASNEGIFLIESRDATLANMAFVNCRRSATSNASLVEIGPCSPSAEATDGEIRFHHVQFRENRFRTGPAALSVQSPSCSQIELRNIQFMSNTFRGGSLVVLAPHNRLIDVNTEGNQRRRGSSETAILHIPENQNTSIIRLMARDNTGSVVRCEGGSFTLRNSVFEDNMGGTTAQGLTYAGGVTLANVTGSVSNSHFAGNRGTAGSGLSLFSSQVTIVDSHFLENTAFVGSGIYAADSSIVQINSSRFLRNEAELDGAALYVNGSSEVTLSQNIFRANTGEDSGAVLVDQGSFASLQDTFRSNTANRGGALSLHRCEVNISGSSFIENTGRDDTGGIFAESLTARLENSTFLRNAGGRVGGGIRTVLRSILFVTNSSFVENTAENGAGINHEASGVLNCSQCLFERNSVPESGGAIASDIKAIIYISDSSFVDNTAKHGAGIKLEPECTLDSVRNTFIRNNASDSGGGIFVNDDCRVTVTESLFEGSASYFAGGIRTTSDVEMNITDSVFSNNKGETNGGAIFVNSRGEFKFENVTFLGNEANAGGALHFVDNNTVVLTRCHLHNNSASDTGGVLFIRENSFVTFDQCSCERNRAPVGAVAQVMGARRLYCRETEFRENSASNVAGVMLVKDSVMEFSEVTSTLNTAEVEAGGLLIEQCEAEISDSLFVNCSAGLLGGAMYLLNSSRVVVQETSFIQNSAPLGGSIYTALSNLEGDNLAFRENSAQIGGAVDANLSSTFLCSLCDFELNVAEHLGGALYAESDLDGVVAYQFEMCRFRSNSADIGGALHVVQALESTPCSVKRGTCAYVASIGDRFEGNRARRAGSILHSTDPGLMRAQCDARSDPSREFLSLDAFRQLQPVSPGETCTLWVRNRLRADGYGEEISTYAQSVSVTLTEEGVEDQVSNRTRIRLADRKSGFPLPEIRLLAVDAFGDGPAIPHAANTTATLFSPDDFFPGNLVANMSVGTGTFAAITGHKQPDSYMLSIEFTDPHLEEILITVDVRECMIGEESTANGTFCQRCDATSFNVDPESGGSCRTCPDHANCTGRFIVPVKGYWHRHPCSSEIQECLSESACDYSGRSDLLSDIADDADECSLTDQVQENYSQALCKEGHTGVLCGSCDDSYGLTNSFECRDCLSKGASEMLALVATLWLILLAGITIRGNLGVHRRRPQRIAPRQTRPAESIPTGFHLELTGIVPLGHPRSSRDLEVMPVAPYRNTQQEEEQIHTVILAKRRGIEIFKVLLNYLQVISVAVTINVHWSEAVYDMFRAAEGISGMAADATTRSLDCALPNDGSVPRSVGRTIIGLCIPVICVLALSLLWAVVTLSAARGALYWAKRSLLSMVAVMYVSYIGVTKTLVKIVYCVDVHDGLGLKSEGTTSYWAMDTSLKCYEGDHLALVGLLSVPFLMIFTLGCPLAYIFVILRHQRDGSASMEKMTEIMGFMFRAYSQKYIVWESVILLRKALLSVVVVFAYPLGGTLQGSLTVIILVVASYVHQISRPFSKDYDELNLYEGLSLLMSCLTFVSGIFFNDDNTSDPARNFLSVCVLFGNFALFFFLFFMLMRQIMAYVEAVLKLEGVSHSGTLGGKLAAFWIFSWVGIGSRIRNLLK